MYKVYQYNAGKLLPSFNGKEFTTTDEAKQNIKWWFEMRRNNQAAQFVIASPEKIIEIITAEDV